MVGHKIRFYGEILLFFLNSPGALETIFVISAQNLFSGLFIGTASTKRFR